LHSQPTDTQHSKVVTINPQFFCSGNWLSLFTDLSLSDTDNLGIDDADDEFGV
ncbi:MAG: hypothetical protein EZS28_038095, partial [Streblomastix strix]